MMAGIKRSYQYVVIEEAKPLKFAYDISESASKVQGVLLEFHLDCPSVHDLFVWIIIFALGHALVYLS